MYCTKKLHRNKSKTLLQRQIYFNKWLFGKNKISLDKYILSISRNAWTIPYAMKLKECVEQTF